MQVGIDISSLVYGRGVSRYTSNLVRALLERKNIQLSAYGSSWRQFTTLQNEVKKLRLHGQFTEISLQKLPPKLLQFAWKMGLNPISDHLPNISVFHSWDWIQPPDKKLPLVSTIHDLAMLKFPETAHPAILQAHQRSWDTLKKRDAHIIAVSQATRKDIIKLLGFAPEKVTVVYEALPLESTEASTQLTEAEYDRIKAHLQLDRPYILCVGTREPRKNLLKTIKAWKPLAKDVDLLIAGEQGWDKTESLQSKEKGLRFLGKVSDKELAVLYGEAQVFVYASLYEGFGLPILEAFYHGTPVVTSNLSSMPEVAGNAAELVDPDQAESIRKGIETVLNEKQTEQQKRLQKMIVRLHLFNWQTAATGTIKVYKQALDATQS